METIEGHSAGRQPANTSEELNRKSQSKLSSTATNDQDRLISAGYQVLNYLREKRHFTHQPTTILEIALQNALSIHSESKSVGGTGAMVAPTGKRDEVLYQSTLKGLSVMKEDYHTAKAALQHKNEQYIAQRNFLSEEGKKLIRQEPGKGEFSVANGQRGHIVASRIEAIQKILNDIGQYPLRQYPLGVPTSVETPGVATPSREKLVPLEPTRSAYADVQAKHKEKVAESLGAKPRSHQTLQDISSGQKQKAENLDIKQDMSVRSRMRR